MPRSAKPFKDRYTIDNNGCWLWNGFKLGGYGAIRINNKTLLAHRYSWMLINGDIQDGMVICHKCDVKECVNPEHLFIGTQRDNIMDAIIKGRLVYPTKKAKIKQPKKTGILCRRDKNRENRILKMYLAKMTLRAIGAEFNISYERVRQIVNRAKREGKLNGS